MTAALIPTKKPLPELRAWLATAERMLNDMTPADDRYAAGRAVWEERHETYMARARAEGEPE